MVGADFFLGHLNGFLSNQKGSVIFSRTDEFQYFLLKGIPFNISALCVNGGYYVPDVLFQFTRLRVDVGISNESTISLNPSEQNSAPKDGVSATAGRDG